MIRVSKQINKRLDARKTKYVDKNDGNYINFFGCSIFCSKRQLHLILGSIFHPLSLCLLLSILKLMVFHASSVPRKITLQDHKCKNVTGMCPEGKISDWFFSTLYYKLRWLPLFIKVQSFNCEYTIWLSCYSWRQAMYFIVKALGLFIKSRI